VDIGEMYSDPYDGLNREIRRQFKELDAQQKEFDYNGIIPDIPMEASKWIDRDEYKSSNMELKVLMKLIACMKHHILKQHQLENEISSLNYQLDAKEEELSRLKEVEKYCENLEEERKPFFAYMFDIRSTVKIELLTETSFISTIMGVRIPGISWENKIQKWTIPEDVDIWDPVDIQMDKETNVLMEIFHDNFRLPHVIGEEYRKVIRPFLEKRGKKRDMISKMEVEAWNTLKKDHSYSEIVKITGRSEGTIKRYLSDYRRGTGKFNIPK